MKPRVLMVGRTRYRLPLEQGLRRKFEVLEEQFELRVLGSSATDSSSAEDPFRLAAPFPLRPLDGASFYASLPLWIARELRRFRPDAVLAQSPYEAAAALVARRLAGMSTPVALDVHGDWRTFARLYGSPLRRLVAPFADRLAGNAVRRADAVRTVSPYTSQLVREAGGRPAAEFPAFMDLEPFLVSPRPLPERPAALFVGVLERYKNVDGLAAVWRRVAPRLPQAQLRIVGSGTLAPVVQELVSELPSQTTWLRRLRTEEVVEAMDSATLLVLPSRSEGMGRVVVEALLRGRPVVASRVGGIPDLVEDGVSGILRDPGDTDGFADALVTLLSDPAEALRLANRARAAGERLLATPEEYAASVRELVRTVTGR